MKPTGRGTLKNGECRVRRVISARATVALTPRGLFGGAPLVLARRCPNSFVVRSLAANDDRQFFYKIIEPPQ